MTDEKEVLTAILDAVTRTLKTMVDGTVRLQIDFEPTDRVTAMKLFGEPGTPIAVALLKIKRED